MKYPNPPIYPKFWVKLLFNISILASKFPFMIPPWRPAFLENEEFSTLTKHIFCSHIMIEADSSEKFSIKLEFCISI